MRFTQLNLHKASLATTLAGQAMVGKSEIVHLLTEPHTIRSKLHGVPRGTKAIYDKQIKHDEPAPRAAIVFSRDIRLTAMDGWCSRDCAVGLIKIAGKQTMVASVYLDILRPIRQVWLEACPLCRVQELRPHNRHG